MYHKVHPFTAAVPSHFGIRDRFSGRHLFHRPGRGWGWFQDDSQCITFIVHFISVIIISAPP